MKKKRYELPDDDSKGYVWLIGTTLTFMTLCIIIKFPEYSEAVKINHNRMMSPKNTAMGKVTDFLLDKNITAVYAPYTVKWRFMANNKEKVIASCYHMPPCVGDKSGTYEGRYPKHHEYVESQEAWAVLLYFHSETYYVFSEALMNRSISFSVRYFGNFVLLYDFNPMLRPKEVWNASECIFCMSYPYEYYTRDDNGNMVLGQNNYYAISNEISG